MENSKSRRDKLAETAVSAITVSAKLCKEYLDENDATTSINDLQSYAREYATSNIKSRIHSEAIANTENYYNDPDNNLAIPIEEIFSNAKGALEISITDEVVNNHRYMVKFNASIEEDIEDTTETDRSLVESNEFVAPIDPITKTAIRNPVRNNLCGHIYENESICSLIAKKNTRCPYIGCPALQYIQTDHLVFDTNLKQRIDAFYLQNI